MSMLVCISINLEEFHARDVQKYLSYMYTNFRTFMVM